jgi:hypothetical protein
MKLELLQFSAVVTGKTHNPTILNPDFLGAEGIVPKSWGWNVIDTLTTPPLAMVRYKNGVTVTVDQGKLQVADSNVEEGPENSKVTEIAAAYVKTLRHVNYTAVGNNFQSLIQIDSPDTFLKELFIKEGPWNSSKRVLEAVGIRLIYPLDMGKLILSLDSGEATIPDTSNKQPVILSNANFNRDCSHHPAFQEVSEFLQKAIEDWAMYQSLLNDIIKKAE